MQERESLYFAFRGERAVRWAVADEARRTSDSGRGVKKTCRWHVFSLRSRRLCRRSIYLGFHRVAKADTFPRRAGRVARPYKYPWGSSVGVGDSADPSVIPRQ